MRLTRASTLLWFDQENGSNRRSLWAKSSRFSRVAQVPHRRLDLGGAAWVQGPSCRLLCRDDIEPNPNEIDSVDHGVVNRILGAMQLEDR